MGERVCDMSSFNILSVDRWIDRVILSCQKLSWWSTCPFVEQFLGVKCVQVFISLEKALFIWWTMHSSVSRLGDTSFSLTYKLQFTISSTSSSSFTEVPWSPWWRVCIKVSQENMVTNLQAELVPLSLGNGTGFVHRGFQAPWLRLGSMVTRRVENSNYNGLGMKWCDRCV